MEFRFVILYESRMEVEKIDSKENLIRLINQYQNLIFSICLKLTGDYFTAEDLTQETFLSAYKYIDSFDGQSEKAWICRIASNKAIDYLKAAGRREVPTLPEDMQGEARAGGADPLQKVLNREIMEEMKERCGRLKPPYCDVATKHFIYGKTAKEIAQESDVPLNTVQTRLYRAREMLKTSIDKEVS